MPEMKSVSVAWSASETARPATPRAVSQGVMLISSVESTSRKPITNVMNQATLLMSETTGRDALAAETRISATARRASMSVSDMMNSAVQRSADTSHAAPCVGRKRHELAGRGQCPCQVEEEPQKVMWPRSVLRDGDLTPDIAAPCDALDPTNGSHSATQPSAVVSTTIPMGISQAISRLETASAV